MCVLQESVNFADDDSLAQVVDLVFTAESCVQYGFYSTSWEQFGIDSTREAVLELEDRVSL